LGCKGKRVKKTSGGKKNRRSKKTKKSMETGRKLKHGGRVAVACFQKNKERRNQSHGSEKGSTNSERWEGRDGKELKSRKKTTRLDESIISFLSPKHSMGGLGVRDHAPCRWRSPRHEEEAKSRKEGKGTQGGGTKLKRAQGKNPGKLI